MTINSLFQDNKSFSNNSDSSEENDVYPDEE